MKSLRFCLIILFTNWSTALGDQQILIDKLTSEYIASEKALWKKIDTQLILLDRGSLLNEIYREHSRILSNDFGEHKVLWSLGIQKYERLVNTILSIDTNINNIKDYLSKAAYTKLTELAKNAATQIQQSADELSSTITRSSFWTDIVSNVIFLIDPCFVFLSLFSRNTSLFLYTRIARIAKC